MYVLKCIVHFKNMADTDEPIIAVMLFYTKIVTLSK